jgi:AcrR family transcriptional regulator
MSDLRKKQRQKRENAITEAAMRLLSEKGYRNTSIEEIAGEAEVGTATVYNYFKSKSELFMSIIGREVESLLARGEKAVVSPPASARDAIYKLVETYFKLFARRYSKQLMREIIVVLFIEQLSIRKRLMGLDYALIAQLTRLLKNCQDRGQVKPGLPVAEAALTIYVLTMGDAIAFIVDDDMTLQSFLDTLKRQITMLFEGFAP